MTNPLESYMRDSLRLALASRGGLWEIGYKVAAELLESSQRMGKKIGVAAQIAADARIAVALGEILDGSAPPRMKMMGVDSLTAVEIDMIAEQMVPYRKKQLREGEQPTWKDREFFAQAGRWAAEAIAVVKEAKTAATEKMAAAEAKKVKAAPEPPPLPPAAELTVKSDEVLPTDAGVSAIAPMWKGIWSTGSAHAANVLTAHKHGLWISERATVQEPGTPDSGWRLAVKRPR